MNVHCDGVVSELVSIDQAAGELVIGVGRKAIVHEEFGLRIEGLRVTFDEVVYFLASRLGSGNRIGSG